MYQLTAHNSHIVRLEDNAWVPIASGNIDYEAYLKWCADGNEPLPAPVENPKVIAQAALDALEQETMMNRLAREFMLVSMQDLAQRQSALLAANGIVRTPQDILNASPGWLKLVEVNAQAANLRKALA